jgi:prepilin peptidase CpaA
MALPFTLLASALLMLAAWRDIATRTIPDTVGLLLVAIGGFARTLDGALAIMLSLGSSLALFLLLMVAYSRQSIGGGDVKVMTAFSIGLPPIASYHFVVATAIAGGLLGVLYLALSRVPGRVCQTRRRSLLGRVLAIEAWRIRRCGPLPYGVAIAAGGIFILFHSGSF